MTESDLRGALAKRPLTVKERHDFAEIWKASSDVDKFEMAATLSGHHVSLTDPRLINSMDLVRICTVIAKLDERYGTTTIR